MHTETYHVRRHPCADIPSNNQRLMVRHAMQAIRSEVESLNRFKDEQLDIRTDHGRDRLCDKMHAAYEWCFQALTSAWVAQGKVLDKPMAKRARRVAHALTRCEAYDRFYAAFCDHARTHGGTPVVRGWKDDGSPLFFGANNHATTTPE